MEGIDIKNSAIYSILFFIGFFMLSGLLSYNPVAYFRYFFDTSPLYLAQGLITVAAFSITTGTAMSFVINRYKRFARKKMFYVLTVAFFLITFVLTLITVSFNIFSYVSMNGFIYSLISLSLSGIMIPFYSVLVINIYDAITASLSAGGIGSLLFSLGCPSCGSLLYSLIGIPAGLAIFPLKGIELKVLSLGLVLYAANKIDAKPAVKPKLIKDGEGITPTQKMITGLLVVYALTTLFTTAQILEISGFRIGFAKNIDVDVESLRSTAQTLRAVFPELSEARSPEEIVSILIPTGTPEYSSVFGGISFDDPQTSLNLLTRQYNAMKAEVKKDQEAWSRYLNLAAAPRGISCEFCCGVGPQGITAQGDLRCGCSHNVALQTLTMGLVKYTDYTDEEILREAMKWKALFFPRNMVSLATQVAEKDISQIQQLPGMVGGC